MNPSAYDHYHARYDNLSYARVQTAVIRAVFGEKIAQNSVKHWAALAQEPAHTILNTAIDAALEISGVEYCSGALRRLTIQALQHDLSDDTIRAITDHLRLFERPGDTQADDFVATIAAIRHANAAEPSLFEAIRSASELHSRQGRCAYHLLTAAHALTQTVMILLKEGETGYMREKLERSAKHQEIARQEMSK